MRHTIGTREGTPQSRPESIGDLYEKLIHPNKAVVASILLLASTAILPAQAVQEYPIPTSSSLPQGIALGPDGNLWFVEYDGHNIGQLNPKNTPNPITETPVPGSPAPEPYGIAAGSDGALWFTINSLSSIGRITPGATQTVTEYSLPASGVPYGITAGPDGALWFLDQKNNLVGQITTGARPVISEFAGPPDTGLLNITSGSDKALWFTISSSNKIGRITTTGSVSEYAVPTANSYPFAITTGPDGALWFTEQKANQIGRIDITTGTPMFSEYPIPTQGSYPQGITAGADGALWFTEGVGNQIGRVILGSVPTIQEYGGLSPASFPFGITSTPDGAIWFTEQNGNNIGRLLAPLTITTTALPSGIVGTPYSATATAVGGTGPYTWTIVPGSGSLPAGLKLNPSSGAITGTPTGPAGTSTLTVQVTDSGSPAQSATQQLSIAIAPEAQTISFGPIPTQTVGTTLTLTATASSGLPVSYTSSTTGVCTVLGNVASFIATASCTITASQAGNGTYAPAAPVSQTFTVNTVVQTITFNPIPNQTVGTPLTLNASASSGLPVSYASSPITVCTVTGNIASFIASGSCTITASQAGNGTYAPAAPVSQTVTVNTISQTITFNPIPTQTVGTPLTLNASASSGLPVSYASSTTGVCTVLGNVASFIATGNCTITASQVGNATYAPAAPVSQTFTVNTVVQTITFNPISTQTLGTPLTLNASASSGLPVSFASSTTGVCTVLGNVASFIAAGSCTITASQAGNATYAPAAPVAQTFTVNGMPQTITFNPILNQTVGTTLTLSASASSSLPVSFASSTAGICTVSGNVASFIAAGSCTITASQAGNAIYAPAAPLPQTFTVLSPLNPTSPSPLPSGTSGAPYSTTLTAQGGTPPYSWSISSGSLPAALQLSAAGLISGTPNPAGTFTFTVQVTDSGAPAKTAPQQLSLTIASGAAASITATSGGTQTAQVKTAFGNPLVVTVKDANGNLVPNASVTFTAPASGASGTFAGGGLTATVQTNASGVATSPAFSANATAGSYSVTASIGTAGSAAFSMTNSAGAPGSITVTSGNNQSAAASSAFGSPLVVVVKDAGGNAVVNASVTFTAPSSGASAKFSGGAITATVQTDASGSATSPTLTANTTAGTYTVTATVTGAAAPAIFSLINTAGSASTITATSGSGQSAPINGIFSNPLVAKVKDAGGNTVANASVTFTAPSSGASGTFAGGGATARVQTNASGVATSPAFIANGTGGAYSVTAVVSGATSPATFSLTNLSALTVTQTSVPGRHRGLGLFNYFQRSKRHYSLQQVVNHHWDTPGGFNAERPNGSHHRHTHRYRHFHIHGEFDR